MICLDWLRLGRVDPVEALPRIRAAPTGGASNAFGRLSLVPDGRGDEGGPSLAAYVRQLTGLTHHTADDESISALRGARRRRPAEKDGLE